MKPIVVLSNKSPEQIGEERGLNGFYKYTDDDDLNPVIVVSKKSANISRTLIHECIHHTLAEMKKDQDLEKLAHRIFGREDFINALATNLAKNLKFDFKAKDLGVIKK